MNEVKKSLEYRATITGAMLIAVYAFITLSGYLFSIVTGIVLSGADQQNWRPWTNTILLFGTVVAFLVTVRRNTILNDAFLGIYCPCVKDVIICSTVGIGATRSEPDFGGTAVAASRSIRDEPMRLQVLK